MSAGCPLARVRRSCSSAAWRAICQWRLAKRAKRWSREVGEVKAPVPCSISWFVAAAASAAGEEEEEDETEETAGGPVVDGESTGPLSGAATSALVLDTAVGAMCALEDDTKLPTGFEEKERPAKAGREADGGEGGGVAARGGREGGEEEGGGGEGREENKKVPVGAVAKESPLKASGGGSDGSEGTDSFVLTCLTAGACSIPRGVASHMMTSPSRSMSTWAW